MGGEYRVLSTQPLHPPPITLHPPPPRGFHMTTENVDQKQQRAREFMSLLPLSLELAGLARLNGR